MAAEAAPAPAPARQCHEAGGGEAGTAQIDTSPLVVTAPGRAPLQGRDTYAYTGPLQVQRRN